MSTATLPAIGTLVYIVDASVVKPQSRTEYRSAAIVLFGLASPVLHMSPRVSLAMGWSSA